MLAPPRPATSTTPPSTACSATPGRAQGQRCLAAAVGRQRLPVCRWRDPYLVNFVQINDFAGADERSWQARYDYNFAALGVPGLTFMTRYISGDNVSRATGGEGKEWERNTELKYVVQSGPLKNVAVRLRNATFRSNFARDADEVRLLVSYSVALW